MRLGLAAAGIYTLFTIALLYPLLSQFGSAFPHDAGDPVLNTWILWRGVHDLPLSDGWWNAPMFFPTANAMALSELLISQLPISAVVQAVTGNPVAAYNVVFALSFPLCGLAAWALARELTGRSDAALVAGLAFMLAPYRAQQLSHVQVLTYYWAPLVLLGLHRYLRERRVKWLALFAATWLAQSLANGYAMFHVSVLVALWIVWFMRPLRTTLPVLIAWACAGLVMLPMLLKYEYVHSSLHLLRDINEVKRFGVDLADFFAAAPELVAWGGRLGQARPETAAFPGVTIVLLGVAALAAERRLRRVSAPQATWQRACVLLSALFALVAFSVLAIGPWAIGPLTVRDFHKPFSLAVAARVAAFLGGPWMRRMWASRSVAGFYVVAAITMLVLALGPEPRMLGRPMLYEPPYAWLMRLPGFEVLRVPARFAMVAALCTSVLVALGIARWANGARRMTVVLLVAAGVLVDGWFRLAAAPVPVSGSTIAWPASVAAVVELPLGDPQADFAAIYHATIHGRPIVNGVSGYLPPHYLPLAWAMRDGHYEALSELTGSGPIGVRLDSTRAGAEETRQALINSGFTAAHLDARSDTFIVTPGPGRVATLGEQLAVQSVSASLHDEDTRRMLDGDLLTAWGTGVPQVGGETIVADLGSSRAVGGVVLEMGAYSFGHARSLQIAVSGDRNEWTQVWEGNLDVLAVRGAVQDPGRSPITIDIGTATGRYVRLTQTGGEPGIPWWIADLHIHAPAQ